MPRSKFFSLLLLLSLFACSRNSGDAVAQRDIPLIAVSIPPQAWFVSRIAGDKVQVLTLAGPGQNPHNYEPTPRQISGMANAGVWLLSGTEFEIVLKPKLASLFPNLPVIDGTEGVKFRLLEDHAPSDSQESPRHSDETPGSIDRHTWLGREPAMILASHVYGSSVFG